MRILFPGGSLQLADAHFLLPFYDGPKRAELIVAPWMHSGSKFMIACRNTFAAIP